MIYYSSNYRSSVIEVEPDPIITFVPMNMIADPILARILAFLLEGFFLLF